MQMSDGVLACWQKEKEIARSVKSDFLHTCGKVILINGFSQVQKKYDQVIYLYVGEAKYLQQKR